MTLLVVLVNWHDSERTLECIRMLRSWRTLRPEIFVVDNQATSDSYGALSRVLEPEELTCSRDNLGYAGGNNLGIEYALRKHVDYVMLLNTDAELREVAAIHLIQRLEKNSDVSILGPVILEGQRGKIDRLIGGRDIAMHPVTRIARNGGALNHVDDYPLHAVDYVLGTVFLTRCGVFEEVGLLDEEYFFSGEIADFCKRAKSRGHKVCVDLEVEAYHHTDKTKEGLRNTLYRYYSLRNRFLYVRKHYPNVCSRYYAYWMSVGARQLGRALVRCEVAQARAITLGMLHGLTCRFGNKNNSFL